MAPVQAGLSPYDILPLELWEHILRHDFAGNDLLTIATVCKTFNVLCIRIFLDQNHHAETLLSEEHHLSSRNLRAFSLCLDPLPVKRLVCNLDRSRLHRDLHRVRQIFLRSKDLQELSLDLCQDLGLFHDPFRDISQEAFPITFSPFFSTIDTSREVMLSAFCSGIAGVVQQASGPLIIVDRYSIFSCRPQDVATCQWNLHTTPVQFAPPSRLSKLITGARRSLGLDVPSYPCDTRAGYQNGERIVKALTEVQSVTIQRITDSAGSARAAMLLTINPTLITVLRLHLPHPAFTFEELSAALVELSLPSLWMVYICADTIDPSALRLFLHRHSGIKSVEYAGFSREGAQRPLFHPPLAHPGLTTLETTAHGNQSSGRLLAALDTSPNLHTFCFRFSCFPTAANLAGLIRDLQRLSARTRETTLRLHLWNRDGYRTGGARFWAAHPDLHAVAQTLHCVQTVNLLTWSVKTAERTLPWLVLLPAVSAVHFTLNFPGRDSELSQAEFTTQRRVFMAKAEAALQLRLVPVPNITVTVC